jgi:hypothetical protein
MVVVTFVTPRSRAEDTLWVVPMHSETGDCIRPGSVRRSGGIGIFRARAGRMCMLSYHVMGGLQGDTRDTTLVKVVLK